MHLIDGAMRVDTFVYRETNSDFDFCADGSGECRLELGKAAFADSDNRRNTLEYS